MLYVRPRCKRDSPSLILLLCLWKAIVLSLELPVSRDPNKFIQIHVFVWALSHKSGPCLLVVPKPEVMVTRWKVCPGLPIRLYHGVGMEKVISKKLQTFPSHQRCHPQGLSSRILLTTAWRLGITAPWLPSVVDRSGIGARPDRSSTCGLGCNSQLPTQWLWTHWDQVSLSCHHCELKARLG